MTKALLTVQDVKNFIYDAICQNRQDCILSRIEVKRTFGISEFYMDKYIEMGLPWFGKINRKKFYFNQVKKWFVENGIEFEVQHENE